MLFWLLMKRVSALCKSHKSHYKILLAPWLDQFISPWMDFMEYEEFDVLMLLTRKPGDMAATIERNLSRIKDDIGDVLRQLEQWRGCGVRDILDILRSSRYVSSAIEASLYPHV